MRHPRNLGAAKVKVFLSMMANERYDDLHPCFEGSRWRQLPQWLGHGMLPPPTLAGATDVSDAVNLRLFLATTGFSALA